MFTELVVRMLLLWLMMTAMAVAQLPPFWNDLTAMTRTGCNYTCDNSNITIPYPFGIGDHCARDEAFVIICNSSFAPTRPFIRNFGVELLQISVSRNFVVVRDPEIPSNQYGNLSANSSQFWDTYNYTRNGEQYMYWRVDGFCNTNTTTDIWYNSSSCGANTNCTPWLDGSSTTELTCSCRLGYFGNPYLSLGCQDFNKCELPSFNFTTGLYRCYYNRDNNDNKVKKMTLIGTGSAVGALLLLFGAWRIYKEMKRRKKIKLKKKFFKRNGGLLLQQQLSSGEEGNVEKTKLFTSKDLDKATDRYNETRILGQGGQGTVYKGMLTDGRIVAIKMSKIVDEDEGKLEEFINEVVILSKINHRNVVKLHGCCLETEVPLLVYEFIPNGTLFQYIHDQNEDFPLTWNVRLRIAAEIAAALSYLHSSASQPIYHRDIKSTNILLDDKYRAKVADFGTSKSISIDQTHCTTRVQGTFGYLDPEYFQSSQFTDKSDVYSFGVVLVELLTGQKPISSSKIEEGRSLATRFILAMKEDRLFDILDARVMKEGGKEEVIGVANLAKRCLNLSGRKRPTMRELAMELEWIRMSNGASVVQKNYEEVEYDLYELTGPWDATSTSTGSYMNVSLDIQPLL